MGRARRRRGRMETKCYIYALIDPRDGAIHYIGSSKNPRIRYRQNTQSVCDSPYNGPTAKNLWVASLRKDGLVPKMVILEETDKAQRFHREQTWMDDCLEKGFPLKNGCRVFKKVKEPKRPKKAPNSEQTVIAGGSG
jgi:hypothetical protein